MDQLPAVLPALQSFIANPRAANVNVPRFYKTAPIDYDDPLLELLPEVFLDAETPSEEALEKAVAEMVRETAAFLVRFGKEDRAGDFDDDD